VDLYFDGGDTLWALLSERFEDDTEAQTMLVKYDIAILFAKLDARRRQMAVQRLQGQLVNEFDHAGLSR
jgi:hypothetical protein